MPRVATPAFTSIDLSRFRAGAPKGTYPVCGLNRRVRRATSSRPRPDVRPMHEALRGARKGFAALGEDSERIVRIAAEILHRGAVAPAAVSGCPWVETLSSKLSPATFGALAHDGAADDERRALPFRSSRQRRLRISLMLCPSTDSSTFPTPTPRTSWPRSRSRPHPPRRKLDVVRRVVVHDEVAQTQMAGDTAHPAKSPPHGAVRDVGVGLVRHPLAEAGSHEPFRDGGAQRHGMTLSERAGSVLDTARSLLPGDLASRCPLTQRLKGLRSYSYPARKRRIEHRRHVTRIEEETITVG